MNDTCSDIESLAKMVKTAGWRRIGIDGVDGEGNALQAAELSEDLGIPALNVTDYLHSNQGGYIDFIDYPALKLAVTSMPSFILCGICLNEVLENLDATLDATVYIMRMRDGAWVDEAVCVFPEGVDVAIEMLAESLATISRNLDEPTEHGGREEDDSLVMFINEVMHYHDRWQPQESADVVFEHAVGDG